MRFPLLLLVVSACASRGPTMTAPTEIIERAGIVVRAEDIGEAERMAGEFADLDRRVRDLLGETEPPTPEFWLLDHELEGPITGIALRDSPIIGLEIGYHDNRQVAAHELAHHYQRRWPSKLPPVIDEGLAELVGGLARDRIEEVRQHYAPILRRTRVESLDNLLGWTAEEVAAIQDRRAANALRSVGFAIADRIGLEGLRQMCQRAADAGLKVVPKSWFAPIWAEVSDRSFQGPESKPAPGVVTFL
jgi:hypothetical protein